ncbi:MAG TPA: nuclear transport factor 2 family protein [Bryobacteraceae bacterium]|nr:nuclear transport factor 2 family protein [Bryobacteraceae bacterium]
METNSVRLILDIYAAFSRGDIPAVLNSLDAGAELTFEGPGAIPWAGTWRGIEGWVRFFQTLADSAEEITLQMEPFAAQDDRVVAFGRYQARVRSTGRRIDSPLVHLWRVRDGRVVGCIELTNTAAEAAACTVATAGA